jgi:hypothetical protein
MFVDVTSSGKLEVLLMGLIVIDGYGEGFQGDGAIDNRNRRITNPIRHLISLNYIAKVRIVLQYLGVELNSQ